MKVKWLPNPKEYPENRLFALDALRGLDMLLLTVVGPLIKAANASWKCFPSGFMAQFAHGWECFTFWDMVMPLFIFMCGAAIPFALRRRLEEGRGAFWRHVLGRVVLLWLLGGLVQGRWIDLDMKTFTPFSNTLQSIAIGYLAVAAVMSLRTRRLFIVVPVVLVALYTVLLAISGYAEYGNIAIRVDQAIFKAILPPDSVYLLKPSHYTWFLTSMMFAAMAFAGYHATMILTSDKEKKIKVLTLLLYGACLLAVGFLSEIWVPCIKPIFTLSFTTQAMGWCVIALAALYAVTDIWMFRRGFSLVLLFGQLALTAYFVSHFFAPMLNAGAHIFGDGLIRHLPGSYAAFVLKLIFVIELIIVMSFWRRMKSCKCQ